MFACLGSLFSLFGLYWVRFLLNIGPYLVCILSWSVLINNLQHRFTTRPRDFSRGGGDEKLYYGTIIINSQVHHEKNLVVSWWALMLDADFYFLVYTL